MSGSNGAAFGLGALVSQGLNAPEALIFNTADPVMLGPVLFDNFEIPERINWGGAQKLTVHTLPGGERIVDALGREEDMISWSGLFLGRGSVERAKMLDVMRAAGNRQQFAFGTLSYTVVIHSFQPEYKFAYQIPYKISLQVVRDNAAPVPDNSVTPDQSIPNDVSTAADAVPADAPQDAVTKTVAETSTKGSTVTQAYQPIEQTAPTVANANIAAGNNLPTSAVSMVDLGPASSLANATPASLVADGIAPGGAGFAAAAPASAVSDSLGAAQLSADSLSISTSTPGFFVP